MTGQVAFMGRTFRLVWNSGRGSGSCRVDRRDVGLCEVSLFVRNEGVNPAVLSCGVDYWCHGWCRGAIRFWCWFVHLFFLVVFSSAFFCERGLSEGLRICPPIYMGFVLHFWTFRSVWIGPSCRYGSRGGWIDGAWASPRCDGC